MSGMDSIIYGLVDPRTGLVRYVGQSKRGLVRALLHGKPGLLSRDENPEKKAWILGLHAAGLNYLTVTLELVDDPLALGTHCWWRAARKPTALHDAECWWIAYGRACGWPLTNMTDGGEGSKNPSMLTRWRMSLAARRRPKRILSPAARLAIGTANRGKRRTPEQLARVVEQWTPERRAEVSRRFREWFASLTQAQINNRRETSRRAGRISIPRLLRYSRDRAGVALPREQREAISRGVSAFWAVPENKDKHPSKRPEQRARMSEAARKRFASQPPTCGTTAAYGRGCRCNACETAHQDQRTRWRNRPSTCGTSAKYNKGCRCDACRAAKSAARKSVTSPRRTCGTIAAYDRGCRCESCVEAHRIAHPLRPRVLAPCGTRSSFVRNLRRAERGESSCGPCDDCVRAAREYRRRRG